MLAVEIILGIVAFALNTYFALAVFLRNYRSWTHRLFLFLAVVIDIYIVINYFSLHPPVATPEHQLMWIRLVMAVVAFVGPTVLLLVHTFPKPNLLLSRKKIGLLGLLATGTAFASLTPAIFSGIEYPAGQPVPIPGPLIPLYFLDFVGLVALSIGLLIYKYRRAQGLEKIQHYYFLIGIVATFSLMAITTTVMTVVFKNTGAVFLGPLVIVFMIGSIAYAILKHQFLDIRMVVARTVSFALLVFLTAIVYAAAMLAFQAIVTDQPLSLLQYIATTSFTVLLMFSFSPMRHVLERTTESIFYHREYDQAELLKKTSKISTSTLSLQKLVDGFTSVIGDEMKVSAIAIAIAEGEKTVALLGSPDIFLCNEETCRSGHVTDDLHVYTKIRMALEATADSVLVFDELAESLIKTVMRERQFSVVLPLIASNKYIGCLLLKEKQNGAAYSSVDIKTLQLIAPQVAIAIRNALSYEEIRLFNVRLESEVDKATSKLRKANKSLKELDKLKDDFVSIASHELRTPMTAIKSYIWMALSGKGGKLTKKQRYYLERSYLSTDRLIKLVNDMLNISRIESHRIALSVGKVDLLSLVTEIVGEIKSRTDELGIKVEIADHCVDAAGKRIGAIPAVIADADKVSEVVMNLLGNALKFTPRKGIITFSFTLDDDMVIVHVSDTGVGMTAETISKLFQKFGLMEGSYRTNQTASQGTGLGLYISRAVVELHKGEIWATSEGEGKGSTFSFSLKVYSQSGLEKLAGEFEKREDVGIIRTRTSFWV